MAASLGMYSHRYLNYSHNFIVLFNLIVVPENCVINVRMDRIHTHILIEIHKLALY